MPVAKRTAGKKLNNIYALNENDSKQKKQSKLEKAQLTVAIVAVVVPIIIGLYQINEAKSDFDPIDYNDSAYFVDLSQIQTNEFNYFPLLDPVKYLNKAIKAGNVYDTIEAYKAILQTSYLNLQENDIQKYAEKGYALALKHELWNDVLFFYKNLNIYHKEGMFLDTDIHTTKPYEIGLAYYKLGNMDMAIRCWDVYLKWAELNSYHTPEVLYVTGLKGQYFWFANDYFYSLNSFKELYLRTMENPDDVIPYGNKLKMLWDSQTFDYIVSNYGKLKLEKEGVVFIDTVFDEESFAFENYYLKSILYSFNDYDKSMDYYKRIKNLKNADSYDIEYLYWCNKQNKIKNVDGVINYYNKKYHDDETSKNINIALCYALKNNISGTKLHLQRAINCGKKNEEIIWLVILKHECLINFRKTYAFNELINDNKPVMKITDYTYNKEIDLFLEF
jgi:tetratricopeptide (TPR) repeat protein